MFTINKFLDLEKEKQRELANELALYLVKFFAQDYYVDEEDLKQDFERFRQQIFFKEIIEKFENEHNVTVGFLVKNSNRWKLCQQCNEPFIAYDTRNRQKICQKQLYIRFTADKKLNINGRSICEIKQRRKASVKWYHKKVAK
ncbi:hypothetical protein PMV44_15950 [Enterococcus casseliflavus]|uniref:hypothetical protein n=1 Tax=Enterococcus casseliflavus TaxID=37734 RepID=UPI00232B9C80|nr:hypothetical protein [Enterococcus casseliflavus]MDB1693342.1 hypothetical protein [Enterococcus casseliflavus]